MQIGFSQFWPHCSLNYLIAYKICVIICNLLLGPQKIDCLMSILTHMPCLLSRHFYLFIRCPVRGRPVVVSPLPWEMLIVEVIVLDLLELKLLTVKHWSLKCFQDPGFFLIASDPHSRFNRSFCVVLETFLHVDAQHMMSIWKRHV